MCIWYEGIKFPGTVGTDSCQLPCGCLGSEPGTSGRAASVLNHWNISPVLEEFSLLEFLLSRWPRHFLPQGDKKLTITNPQKDTKATSEIVTSKAKNKTSVPEWIEWADMRWGQRRQSKETSNYNRKSGARDLYLVALGSGHQSKQLASAA